MPRTTEPQRDVYPSLMEANEDAFAGGRYETAYHALMAALHAAQDRHEAARLDRVSTLAQRQQEDLDATAPEHRLSRSSAIGHGHPGLYAQASRQADAQASMARLRERRAETG